ncbi:hypothetical protein BDR06DRAFT_967498 [Suillus hirtellus]|nr:hypothetical protein BDR06DRAFT_967498 [Suillus hirtellus]
MVYYQVQDKDMKEYALKDCWVDADIIDHKVSFLKAVDGVPNVVQLVKYWDINLYLSWSMFFLTLLLILVAYRMLIIEWKILYEDLSPNNLIIYEGKGYFINFDHAKFIQLISKVKDSHGTAQWSNHRLRDGLGISGSLKKELVMKKTPIYEPALYFQACYFILKDWHRIIKLYNGASSFEPDKPPCTFIGAIWLFIIHTPSFTFLAYFKQLFSRQEPTASVLDDAATPNLA